MGRSVDAAAIAIVESVVGDVRPVMVMRGRYSVSVSKFEVQTLCSIAYCKFKIILVNYP